MANEKRRSEVRLPLGTVSSTYFVDESGSKGSGGDFFVVGAVKTQSPDVLNRQIQRVRETHQFRKQEFKFGEVTKNSLPMYKELIELLVESEVEIGAFVIDKDIHDPFNGRSTWEGHIWVTAALLKGMTHRRELVTVLVDGISTPQGIAYGAKLQDKINRTFGTKRVVSAVSLDSCTCDGLQLADLIASGIAHQRKTLKEISFDEYIQRRSPKAQLATYMSRALGLPDFGDHDSRRIRIRTVRETGDREVRKSLQE